MEKSAPAALPTSDSLNISERARWVACLLGSTRGHGRQDSDIIPTRSGRGIKNNTFDVGNGNVSAAWPPGHSGRNNRICSFFCSVCSPCSGRRRNSILPYAPDHLAFSPQRFLTATTPPRRSTQVRYISSALPPVPISPCLICSGPTC